MSHPAPTFLADLAAFRGRQLLAGGGGSAAAAGPSLAHRDLHTVLHYV